MAFVFAAPAVIQPSRMTAPKKEVWLPIVTGLASAAARNSINDQLRETTSRLAAGQGELPDPRAEMIGWFETKNNQKNYLSMSLFNYAYTGGAHGLTLQASLTMSLRSGRSYTLAQLFKPGADYVAELSALVAEQIRNRDIQTLDPFQAIRPNQDYYIADRSLVLYFQLYELTPYVFGFPYFPISVYAIQNIVAEDGPLGPMLYND